MKLNQPIAKGNTADIYLYDGKIVKVFHDRLPDAEAEYEAAKQRTVYLSGVPVPEVFDVCRVNGRQAIIMEYVEGATLGELMQQDPGQAAVYLAHSVDIQIDMHKRTITDFESMRDRLSTQLQKITVLDEQDKNSLLMKLAELPMDNKLCHGDFHAFNLIKAKDKTVIIDWVDASAGSPCADACRSYILYSQYSADLADSYLRLYCDRSGVKADDIFAWAPIIAGARLCENVSAESVDRLLEIAKHDL